MVNYVDINRNKRILEGVYSSAQKRKLPEASSKECKQEENKPEIKETKIELLNNQYSQILDDQKLTSNIIHINFSEIDTDYHKLFYSSLSNKETVFINNKKISNTQIKAIVMIKQMTEIIVNEFPEFNKKEEFLATNILGKLNFDINDIFLYLKDKESNQKLIWTEEEDRLLIGNRNLKKLIDKKGKDRVERRKQFLKPRPR
jgi:hypothetical protein